METAYIPAAALVTALLLWWFAAARRTHGKPPAPILSQDTIITSTPLLTDAQAVIYNLLRLAVHDRYLVFAQVPLWSFIRIEAAGTVRSQIYRQIALRQVDFALVHPGSRLVEQVVQIVDASTASQDADRSRIVRTMLQAVGIPLREVKHRHPYSVTELSALLELKAEE